MRILAQGVVVLALTVTMDLTVAMDVASVTWKTFTIAETHTSVEYPSSVFVEQAGSAPEGYGQRFQTADHRANLTIQATANASNDSPARFLARKGPPRHIQYKRVTSRFFAVSSYRGDNVW